MASNWSTPRAATIDIGANGTIDDGILGGAASRFYGGPDPSNGGGFTPYHKTAKDEAFETGLLDGVILGGDPADITNEKLLQLLAKNEPEEVLALVRAAHGNVLAPLGILARINRAFKYVGESMGMQPKSFTALFNQVAVRNGRAAAGGEAVKIMPGC